MKSEAVKVDIKHTLQIIRGDSASSDEFSSNSGAFGSKKVNKMTLPVKKKPVNIPICEVTIDDSYEKSIPVSYSLPPSYVKHIRKIVEDSDIGTDYVADKDDMAWVQLIAKHYPTEGVDVEFFEMIINNFERANGHSRDTMTQSVAMRALGGRFDFTQQSTHKLISEMYKYWVTKRDKWGKALVRKYWPVVPATDTNPHLVFRMRDRERYRLRRHRRNDLDSFRKLQQFRREFEQAKNVAHLMLERESIGETEFTLARDIFAEEMRDLGCSLSDEEHFDTSPEAAPLVYEPLFRHLWVPINTVLPDVPPSDFDLLAMVDDASECTSLKDTATLKNKNRMQRASEDGRLSALTIDGLEAAAVEKKTEKKKKKTDKLVLYGNDGQEIMDVTGRNSTNQKNQKRGFELGTNDFNFLGYSKPSLLEEELPLTMSSVEDGNLETKIIHDSLEGPKIICRPSWPHYYEKNAQGRGRIYIDGPEDYLESLELRRDEYGEPMIPHKYRIRYRVGRGGRLIADKVPIYRNPQETSPSDDEEGDVNEDAIRYFYPTQSRPAPLTANRDNRAFPPAAVQPAAGATVSNGRTSLPGALVSAVAEMPAERPVIHMSASTVSGPATKPLPEYPNSNRRVMNQVRKYGKLHTPGYAWSSSTIPPFAYLPPTVPPGPVAGWLEKQDRLQQILGGNDSEDEEVLVDHSYNNELGEFSRLLQKQAEVLTNAAQAIQATATTQKKNQQLQQLARIKMTIEA